VPDSRTGAFSTGDRKTRRVPVTVVGLAIAVVSLCVRESGNVVVPG
jgi:hypothetical protein